LISIGDIDLNDEHSKFVVMNICHDCGETGQPMTMQPMTITFDYGAEAELFDHGGPAESSSSKGRRFRRQHLGYRRFARAADAIRFAIEDMAPQLLRSACLEVDEERFDSGGIRRLYESTDYPLDRPATPS
jgi:hypothetical protein